MVILSLFLKKPKEDKNFDSMKTKVKGQSLLLTLYFYSFKTVKSTPKFVVMFHPLKLITMDAI